MKMENFAGKKVLVVGLGRTGFSVINLFLKLDCQIKITDIKPIFDLNKAIKKLKKIIPNPTMTLGEHKDEDFLEADVVVYSASVNPDLPQLELARKNGKEVYSEFSLANALCDRPIVAVCGSFGRTTVANMIGYTLRVDGKNVFVGGTSESPFIEYCLLPNKDTIDYVVVEVSAIQMKKLESFRPKVVVFTNIGEKYSTDHFKNVSDYMETKLSILKMLTEEEILVVNFDSLASNPFFRNVSCQTYWYSRRSFVTMGVMNEVQGTHFHNRRINSNVNYHSEFKVNEMRVIGVENRENLLAAVTACKALDLSDKAIQSCIAKFPGIPHRLEFVVEKEGVCFYNDSKSETMENLIHSIKSFKQPAILIAGGKDIEELEFEQYADEVIKNTRLVVLVGECKERLNRALGITHPIFMVGSFEESVLLAYQKSRIGDTVLLSPGNPSTDFFRDYEERGNYYKKLVFQL